MTGLDPSVLTGAVLQALQLQDVDRGAALTATVGAMGGRVFDLVMQLRHMCLLNFKPPEGAVSFGGTIGVVSDLEL